MAVYLGTNMVNVHGGQASGSSGDYGVEDGLITRLISGAYENSRVTTIGDYAFYSCSSLTAASFPNATTIGNYAFGYCARLTTASFPSVTSIGNSAFYSCPSLTTVSFPNVTSIGNYAFGYCASLTAASFPSVISIGSSTFRGCSKLMSLYILTSSVATLGTSVFVGTPMSNSTYTGSFGSIYVPASLVDSYKTATNWSTYATRITSYVE